MVGNVRSRPIPGDSNSNDFTLNSQAQIAPECASELRRFSQPNTKGEFVEQSSCPSSLRISLAAARVRGLESCCTRIWIRSRFLSDRQGLFAICSCSGEESMPIDAADLGAWLNDARAGSSEAFGKLFDVCHGYLLLVARGEFDIELQAKGGTSDVVQDTFLEAQRDFAAFHGTTEKELLAWLRRLLLNNLSNFSRRFSADRQTVGPSGSVLRRRGERQFCGRNVCRRHAFAKRQRDGKRAAGRSRARHSNACRRTTGKSSACATRKSTRFWKSLK